jgi:hypothetical protein
MCPFCWRLNTLQMLAMNVAIFVIQYVMLGRPSGRFFWWAFYKKKNSTNPACLLTIQRKVSYRWKYAHIEHIWQLTSSFRLWEYGGADKSLARPGKKQTNVSVRMACISFGALSCRGKKWWQLASRCCWNRQRPWHSSEFVSFLVELRTYQHPGS